MNLLIDDKYRLGRKIGSGSFGDVYIGLNKITNENVAIKLQKKDKCFSRTIENEHKALESVKEEDGFPKVKYFANLTSYTVLVSDLLGPNLEDILRLCGGSFTEFTLAFIGQQILTRIESLHKKGYIHRDIKPENFLFGLKDNSDKIFMIDLGLATKYIVSKKHVPFTSNKNFIGTARFSSPSSHNGFELSRRDDLISFCYMLIYFKKGKLPWQGISAENKNQKMEKIKEIKNRTSLELLCETISNNKHLYFMIKYCKNLKFDETPNYFKLGNYLYDLKISSLPESLLKAPFYMNDWNLYEINVGHNKLLYDKLYMFAKKIEETNFDEKKCTLDSINWAKELKKINPNEPIKIEENVLIEADKHYPLDKKSRVRDFLFSSFKNLSREYIYHITTYKKLKLNDLYSNSK